MDFAQIVQAIENAYRTCSTFKCKTTMSTAMIETDGQTSHFSTTDVLIIFARPGHLKADVQVKFFDSPSVTQFQFMSGKSHDTVYMLLPDGTQTIRHLTKGCLLGALTGLSEAIVLPVRLLFGNSLRADDQEQLVSTGKCRSRVCYVLKYVSYGSRRQIWIDMETMLIVRSEAISEFDAIPGHAAPDGNFSNELNGINAQADTGQMSECADYESSVNISILPSEFETQT